MTEQKDIKKMTKGQKIFWIILDVMTVGSIVLTQLAGMEALKLPAILATVASAMGNTAHLFINRYFPKK